MTVMVSLLRGINVGGHNKIKMDALRALYESLGFRDVQTHLQSGNVVFRTERRDLALLCNRIENGIERSFGFRPNVMVRTPAELREVIARSPVATRPGIDPSRFLVIFLTGDPSPEARDKVLQIKAHPEELWIEGRHLYIYYPNGMARPTVSPVLLERMLKTSGTGRNWNTVTKLLEIAEKLEGRL